MRIAFFVGKFPEISETFILYQVTGLLDLGHDVHIYSEYRPNHSSLFHPEVLKYQLHNKTTYLEDRIPGAAGTWEMPVWPADGETWIEGEAIPNKKRILDALPYLKQSLSANFQETINVLDHTLYPVESNSLSGLYRLAVLSEKTGLYDIIHCHFGPVGNKFRFLRKVWNIPLVVTFHGYDFSSYPRIHGPDVYAHLFSLCDLITVNSVYARNRLIELGCTAGKIRQFNVGIRIATIPFRERTININNRISILTVGRLVEKKGIEYSIRAFAAIIKKYPGSTYDIVGDGPLFTQLQALAQELGVISSVHFHGAKDSIFVMEKMKEADIFILSSITAVSGDQEGTPVVLMEAQAMGLPVISTDYSGIPEVISRDKSGFLVEEKNVEAITEKLLRLIETPGLAASFGIQGRKIAEEKFDLDQLNKELESLYLNIIHG